MTGAPEGAAAATSSGLITRLDRWRRLLQIRPHDTSTPEGRSAERYRRVAWSTLLSAIARIISLAISFITVPLVIGYLDTERYGMWVTMTSLVAALGPLDLGIGLGLLTVLAHANGVDDREGARRAVSTALVMLGLIAGLVGIALGVAYPFIPWAHIFNVVSPLSVAEAGPASVVIVTAFALGLPLSVVGTIQTAYQSGFVSSAWAIVGNLASLAAVILVIATRAPLPVLAVALTFGGLLAALMNGWILFGLQRAWLRPRLSDVDRKLARSLLRTGGFFLVLQLAGLAAYQLDNFVIAQVLGAEAVPEYAIPAKLFQIAPTLLSFALTPLWPAYREALARGDHDWVVRTLRRSVAMAAAINIPSSIILVLAGPLILEAWVGTRVHPTFLLLVGLGLWSAFNTINGPLAMLLNGANVIAFQAICAMLMAAANVVLSVLLVSRIGVSGAIYGTVIAQVLFVFLPQIWYVPRLLSRLRESGVTGG